jgi:hypothetical protein
MRFDPVNLRKHRTDVRRTEDYDCGRSFKKKRALRDSIEPVTVKTDLLSAICAALSLSTRFEKFTKIQTSPPAMGKHTGEFISHVSQHSEPKLRATCVVKLENHRDLCCQVFKIPRVDISGMSTNINAYV